MLPFLNHPLHITVLLHEDDGMVCILWHYPGAWLQDGWMDLLFANDDRVGWFRNTGNGVYAATPTIIFSDPSVVLTGLAALALWPMPQQGAFALACGKGTWVFVKSGVSTWPATPVAITDPTKAAYTVESGDVNADGQIVRMLCGVVPRVPHDVTIKLITVMNDAVRLAGLGVCHFGWHQLDQ